MPAPRRCGVALVCLLLSLGFAKGALASSRPYAWAYTTDTGLEGDSGTEGWLELHHALDTPLATDDDAWELWWGFTTTPVDKLELALYAIAQTNPATVPGATTGSAGLSFYGVEGQVRWHLAEPLLLLGKVDYRPEYGPSGELLVVLEHRFGVVLLTGNMGASLTETAVSAVPQKLWVTGLLNLGASFSITESFRLGVEAFGQLAIQGKAPFSAFAGPTIFYGKGKLWAALNVSGGVSYVPQAPAIWSRLIVGASF